MCHFFPASDLNLYFWDGGGKVLPIFKPKNTFTFLFLPPFFLSFLLSSSFSSFLSLLSFFSPSLLPFFFFSFLSMKNVSFFSQPLIKICTFLGGWVGGGITCHFFSLKTQLHSFFASFLSFHYTKLEVLEPNLLFPGGILLNTISHPKNMIRGIGRPFLTASAVNVF